MYDGKKLYFDFESNIGGITIFMILIFDIRKFIFFSI